MNEIIERNIDRITSVCRQYHILTLFAFGSVLTEKFNGQSDVDLLVSFDKSEITDYFNNYFDLKYALEDIFKRKVDLVEDRPFKNPYLQKSISNTKMLIYGR
jgi:predicted nucleotidyltransferase